MGDWTLDRKKTEEGVKDASRDDVLDVVLGVHRVLDAVDGGVLTFTVDTVSFSKDGNSSSQKYAVVSGAGTDIITIKGEDRVDPVVYHKEGTHIWTESDGDPKVKFRTFFRRKQ